MTTQATPAGDVLPQSQPAPIAPTGPKHLVFVVAGERYAMPLSKVRGILGYVDIQSIPAAPQGVRGTVSLHGQSITVIDLRARIGLPPAPRDADSCIIVVEISAGDRRIKAGLMADQVGEVAPLESTDIRPSEAATLTSGAAEIAGKPALLIDLDRVFNGDEASQITKLLAA